MEEAGHVFRKESMSGLQHGGKHVFAKDGRVRPLCPKCNVYLDEGKLRPVMYGYENIDEMEY